MTEAEWPHEGILRMHSLGPAGQYAVNSLTGAALLSPCLLPLHPKNERTCEQQLAAVG
jgi:hypothetical protein